MKTLLLSLAAATLTLFATATTFAQGTPLPTRLELTLGGTLGTGNLGADLGLQYGLSPKVALRGQVGAVRGLQRVDAPGFGDIDGGTLIGARLLGGVEWSGGLRAYAKTDNTGLFGALDLTRTSLNVEATSRRDANLLSATADILGAIIAGPLKRGSVNDVAEVTRVTATGLRAELGYAFGFGGGDALELSGYAHLRRSRDRYAYDGLDGPDVERRVSEDFRLGSYGVRVVYRVPLWR